MSLANGKLQSQAHEFALGGGESAVACGTFHPMRHLAGLLTSILPSIALAANWPQFRGPLGVGHAPEAAPPIEWSETNNVVWKTPIHGKGWSTPVVFDDRIWVTTATEDGKQFFAICLDRATGKIVVDRKVFDCAAPEPLGNPVNAYASPSPLADGGRVFIHFGSYGTACLDVRTGVEVWRRTDLPCRHYRGPGSSVVQYGSTIILTMDGVDVQYLIALDKATGKTVWKTDRTTDFKDIGPDGKPHMEGDLRKAYTTPLMITPKSGAPWFISSGAKATYAYDAATGKERWNVAYDGFSNASSPVYSHGLAIINTGYGKANLRAYAVDDAMRGQLTRDHLTWECLRRVPQRSTPVVAGDHLFMVDDGGFASCLDVKTGDVKWSERLDGNFSGSPTVAGGMIYAASEQGDTFVIKPDPAALTVAKRNKLDAGTLSCPVAVDRELYLRTKTHLYRIEARKE